MLVTEGVLVAEAWRARPGDGVAMIDTVRTTMIDTVRTTCEIPVLRTAYQGVWRT